jgi:hypothetical protein
MKHNHVISLGWIQEFTTRFRCGPACLYLDAFSADGSMRGLLANFFVHPTKLILPDMVCGNEAFAA